MPHQPSLLKQQSPEIQDQISKMAQTRHLNEIVEWVNAQGIPATWNQVRYFISTNSIRTRLMEILPQKTHIGKARQYIGLLVEYDSPTFTINNLRMRGSSWSGITIALNRAGLIESMRDYSPKRWRILASKEELRAWLKKEEEKQ